MQIFRTFLLLITFSSLSVTDDCGTRSYSTGTIFGGNYAVIRQWPWFARLFRIGQVKDQFFCGGSLISDKHVLTGKETKTKFKKIIKIIFSRSLPARQ